MAAESRKRKRESSSAGRTRATSQNPIKQLAALLHHDFATDLTAVLAALPAGSSIQLKLQGEIVVHSVAIPTVTGQKTQSQLISLGIVNLNPSDVHEYLRSNAVGYSHVIVTDGVDAQDESLSQHHNEPVATLPLGLTALSPENENQVSAYSECPTQDVALEESQNETIQATAANTTKVSNDLSTNPVPTSSTTRQLQANSREFPQRKNKDNEGVIQMRPSSIDKFIAGVWKQIYSSVQLAPISLDERCFPTNPGISHNQDVFREINSLCLRVSNISRRSRSLEIIIQAYWVDCYDNRVKEVGSKRPLSATETKMLVLREACAILKWSEKELRNRLAIWRGYKEIKDAGGWACLAFAGSGIYRLCKYRIDFGKDLVSRLSKFKHCFQVAADTIHPHWRKLLDLIGVETSPMYTGHPHDWVVSNTSLPVPLKSTYTHHGPNFQFTHLDDSVLDETVWGTDDPRVTTIHSAGMRGLCNECGYFQSNSSSANECRCYPELYGDCKVPPAVQVFRTACGKNNGLIARCDFPRGTAIGEFIGQITKGIKGTDVMQGGKPPRQYQIFQDRLGNYTRFVNHSCAPNSRFQKFCWLGSERIILVSSGVEAGQEVTVDYSHEYWEGLDKECLCGHACCRYGRR